MFNIKKIEAWGTGIVRMKRLMREYGLKEPEFRESEVSFSVIFVGPSEKILETFVEEAEFKGLNERQKKL